MRRALSEPAGDLAYLHEVVLDDVTNDAVPEPRGRDGRVQSITITPNLATLLIMLTMKCVECIDCPRRQLLG